MHFKQLFPFFTLLALPFALNAGERDFLFRPMKVHGERHGASVARPDGEIPLDYLPCTFRVTVRARDAEEAWTLLTPLFDQALGRLGLQAIQGTDVSNLGGLPGSFRFKDSRLYRCGNPGAMERLRQGLLFVNPGRDSKGWIRQIVVGIGPVPNSTERGADQNLWRDEYGLRVYVVGRPEQSGAAEDLPFDATPLMSDLAQTLAASAR